MRIISIEERTFTQMMERFDQVAQRVIALCAERDTSMKKWLDNQDVCMMLGISKRTLQTYRDNGVLPYSQINHKMYYKQEDLEKFIYGK